MNITGYFEKLIFKYINLVLVTYVNVILLDI